MSSQKTIETIDGVRERMIRKKRFSAIHDQYEGMITHSLLNDMEVSDVYSDSRRVREGSAVKVSDLPNITSRLMDENITYDSSGKPKDIEIESEDSDNDSTIESV